MSKAFTLLFAASSLFFLLSSCAGDSFIAARFAGDVSARNGKPSIVFAGDTQRTTVWERILLREQNDDARRAVLASIAREDPGMLVILGDLVSDGSSDAEWRLFDEYSLPVAEQGIPVYPVLGNHDYLGDNATALGKFFTRFPHLGKKTWSSVTFQSVGIILLNSNFDELSAEQISEQSGWYQRTLRQFQENDTITAVIVACHHPPFTNSTIISDDEQVQRSFVQPFLATPKARLFCSGHCHAYEHFSHDGKDFIVSGGGGGPRQRLEVDPARQRHHDLYQGKAIRNFHFCKVSLEPHQLRFQMIMADDSLNAWGIGDEFAIRF